MFKISFSRFSLGISLAFLVMQPAHSYSIRKSVTVQIPANEQLPGIPLMFGSIIGRTEAKSDDCKDEKTYSLPDPSLLPLNGSTLSICPKALAFANSSATGSFDVGTNTATGTVEVNGDASVSPPGPASAFAGSRAEATLRYITAQPNGNINVSLPIVIVSVSGKTGEKVKDPISFLVQNDNTGDTLLEGIFLEIIADFKDGTFNLNSGVANFIDVIEGSFSIKLDNPFIDTSGTLLAEISNGILVTSQDSGIFDGLLPSVGSIGSFSFLFPDINFSYDLPDFGKNVSFSIGTGVEGSASAAIPEPSSILGLLALGTLGAASTLKRQLKHSKSTKKETTKIG